MTDLIDLVNFNADASCLDSADWLEILAGGDASKLCHWLGLYVRYGRKIALGFTGATIADLYVHNPEALELVRRHTDIFEVVVRPFSHDIALIRERSGFSLNLALGMRAATRHFQQVVPYFLPPEFMLSNEQAAILAEQSIQGVFVNADRLGPDIRTRVPDRPYWLRGLADCRLRCLPVAGEMTRAYLDSLHGFGASEWNAALARSDSMAITWRDGESPFLIPDGLAREEAWLKNESGAQRRFLSEVEFDYTACESLQPHQLRSYPVHSFLAWIKEFRMIGYLARLQRIEGEVGGFSQKEQALWLQAINSDVFSAVEKRSPQIRLIPAPGATEHVTYTILRSERGFEGEEFLVLLEHLRRGNADSMLDAFLRTDSPHARKLRGRLDYLISFERCG